MSAPVGRACGIYLFFSTRDFVASSCVAMVAKNLIPGWRFLIGWGLRSRIHKQGSTPAGSLYLLDSSGRRCGLPD